MSPSNPEGGHDLVTMLHGAAAATQALLADALMKVRQRVTVQGRAVPRLLDREQRATHALAWLAAHVEAIREASSFADRMHSAGALGEVEQLALRIGVGEYLAQIFGGIPMSQGEIARPMDLGLSAAEASARLTPFVQALITSGNTASRRERLVELLRAQHEANPGAAGLDDTVEAIREEMRKFAVSDLVQQAQRWHLSNSYVPVETIAQMAELGVFGLAIPETFGGMGLGKLTLCVAAEELSRGYIGVGSLAIRSEIAADLILHNGSEEQKRHWLPKLAAGTTLPAVALTEPGSGTDLASITTRADRVGSVYRIKGTKTWITHAARADLMVLLVRTNQRDSGPRGLSILLAEKPRANAQGLFPVAGLSGTEIPVLGYRGMKEFEMVFDGFEVPASSLLGGVEGLGFEQVMRTFETARIQTAARAVGVAQSALDQVVGYSVQRMQFGRAIIDFPRVGDKIAMMAAEIAIVRQLAYAAARKKDSGARCDVEAATAKLLATRLAWAAADNSLQIHGANGLALEFPISRILCDARVLNILEGSSEILAQVAAQRLLEDTGA